MKTCNKCLLILEENEFGKEKKGKDGLKSSCKNCLNVQTKKWKKENPEKVKALDIKWKNTQHEKIVASRKKYNEKESSKIKISEKGKRYRANLQNCFVRQQLRRDGFSDDVMNEYPILIKTKRIILQINRKTQ